MPKLKLDLEFDAIGTRWFIELERPAEAELRRTITARIETFDRAYSRFRADSLVTRMARTAGRYAVPADAAAMLTLYHWLYLLTNGAMTPLIGQTLSDAGYDATYRLTPIRLKTPPEWDDVISFTPHELILAAPALLDFGAMGKGYLVDSIAELILAAGHTALLVNAGGDMTYVGSEPIGIGLEDPHRLGTMLGRVELTGGMALCGSASNRRDWGVYHHVIDPYNLTSPREQAAVWVVATPALLADALTTALTFISPEILQASFDFEYAIIMSDGTRQTSARFPARFPARFEVVTGRVG